MARDYASKMRQKEQKKKGLSIWVWVAILVVLSGLGGLIFLLEHHPPQAEQSESQVHEKIQKEPVPEPVQSPVEKPKAPTFDFYTELSKKAPESIETIALPTEDVRGSAYYLQVSTVGHKSEVARLRDRLGLLGFTVGSRALEHKGKTWYQVNVGPFDTLIQAHGASNELLKHGFKSLLRRGHVDGTAPSKSAQ